MVKSRSEYAIKNAIITITMQILRNMFSFINQTVFIYVLGSEYLGINSLFSEILTVLSFAELGIGNAMIFSMYKPLAENNIEKIKSLMKLYEQAYRIIGVVVALLGIGTIPFLKYIIGDISYVEENIILIYGIYLFNSVISYFFVYKRSLIIADQKNYIVDIYQQIFYTIQVALQIIFLLFTKQFIFYLIIATGMTFLNNYWVARKADKMYPYLKEKNVSALEKTERAEIFNNIKALVVYKIGGILLDSTDSIFISSIINIITVGLYANYKLVINVFRTAGSQIINAIMSSVGNLNATANDKQKEKVFNELFYINIWFYGLTSVGMCVCISELIQVWLGEDYIIPFSAVFAAILYYYIQNMHYPCYTYRTTSGLFVYGKFAPLFCAIVNIILDVILGIRLGLTGILLASLIARLVTTEIIDPFLIYRKVFHSPVRYYVFMYFKYTFLVMINGLVCYIVTQLIIIDGIVGLLIKILVTAIIFNILFLMETIRTESFQSIFSRIKTILIKKC